MPVNVLLCEGNENSPEVMLLRAICKKLIIEVRASGGKEVFPSLVRSLRTQNSHVCGIVDGDFPRKPDEWKHEIGPRTWMDPKDGNIMLGWQWSRKEVENYFIDPDVLERALNWNEQQKATYAEKLEGVFDALGHVTAARIALTACAPRRNRVKTKIDINVAEQQIKEALRQKVGEHNKDALMEEKRLLDAYDECLKQCRRGGRFRSHALEVFAGKDVLSKIQGTSGFGRELKNVSKLQENVLKALEHDTAPHTWLPEWTVLRSAVETWTPSS